MKASAVAFGLVVIALSACGSGSLGTSGAAGSAAGTVGTGEGATGGTATVGTAGTGGTAGTTGPGGTGGAIGGTAGTGGTLPACGGGSDGASDTVSFSIVGADGMLVEAPVTAPVTVTALDDCPSAACPAMTAVKRIVLAGVAPQQWTLYLRNTAMPADVIKVGDMFDLTVDASVDQTFYRTDSQTVVLARNGKVMMFAARLSRFGSPPLPNLLPFEIAVSDAGATCESPAPGGCGRREHALRVSIATDASVVIAGGQTGQIGGLSITNGALVESVDTGFCDSKSGTIFAGFRLAGTGGTAGAGGAAGTGGTGGAGGSGAGGAGGSALNACVAPASGAVVEVAILGADGAFLTTAVNAPVTVTSVAGCTATTCATSCTVANCPEVTTAATRIALAGAGQEQWTLYLRNTAMPADVIKVGDRFDLAVDAKLDSALFTAINQTVTLSRDGKLLVFAANTRQFFVPPAPNLQAFGVTIEDGGAVCERQETCISRPHDARVTVGSDNRFVGNGQTVMIGDLSFTNGVFMEWRSSGVCGDPPKSQAVMAGFRVP